jgi:hypothetical protein
MNIYTNKQENWKLKNKNNEEWWKEKVIKNKC